MGGGLAWVACAYGALQHWRNRNERSHCEHSHCVIVGSKPCQKAITAESFSHRDAFGMYTFGGPPAPSGKV